MQKPSFHNVLFMSTPGANFDYAIMDGLEIQFMIFGGLNLWGAPAAIGGALGFKKSLFEVGESFYSALLVEGIVNGTYGGSSPGDEVTDGQQIFAQDITNNKFLYGAKSGWINSFHLHPRFDFSITPLIGLYHVDVSKAWSKKIQGTYFVKHFQLSLGASLYLGPTNGSRRGFIRPEVSFARYFESSNYPIDNITYGISFGSEMF